jgi:hypothetical protein
VPRVRATGRYRASVHQAEQCWYETASWPQWVDELARVIEVSGDWPSAGARVVWESGPAGRGRVTERVIAHEPLEGHTVAVEDDSIAGEQSVAFDPDGDQVRLTLELRYRIKRRNPFTPLIDLLFIRRLMTGSLQRTLTRFGTVLEARVQGRAR